MRRSRQALKAIERRTFLKLVGGAAGGAVALGSGGTFVRARRADAQVRLTPFVDALPIPRGISPNGRFDRDPLYLVTMQVVRQKLHRDLPPSTLWAYNGQYPGPTFEARRGQPIAVRWMNNLPSRHMFPIDDTLHGVGGEPDVRTVVHLHGHKVLPKSDGYPEAWFTNGFARTGPFFEQRTYRYPNDQAATQLWYHDHALGATRLNNYAGLSGVYLVRDRVEDGLNLPSGPFEIPLVIQDRLFNPDGSLLYPMVDKGGDPDPRVPPIWIPEFFGDTVLVNGKVWPFLEVEPRKYRFRILNASNARFYHLTLNEAGGPRNGSTGRSGPSFIQIGTDGGLLPAPIRTSELTIGIAERFDVIIDFSGAEGQSFVLNNDAKAPFPDGDDVVPDSVMLFKVARRASSRDQSEIPRALARVPLLDPRAAVKTRDLVLTELDSAEPFENPIIALINATWADPVTETPRAGSVEVWRMINTTGDAHPIHVHLVQFQILDRQPFDPAQYPGRLVFTGPRVVAPPDERPAFKDTVKAMPGEVVRVVARFDLPSGTSVRPGQKFRYVFHCHILEHEDNDMMRPYDVVG